MKRNRFSLISARALLAIASLLVISGCGDSGVSSTAIKAYQAHMEGECMTPDESVPDITFFSCRYAKDFSKSLASYLKRTGRKVRSIAVAMPDYEKTYIVMLE